MHGLSVTEVCTPMYDESDYSCGCLLLCVWRMHKYRLDNIEGKIIFFIFPYIILPNFSIHLQAEWTAGNRT